MTWIKDLGISSRRDSWLYSVFSVHSHLTHQFVWLVAVWSSEPQHRRAFLKTRAWGWHSSRGCSPSFYWHRWAGSLQGGRVGGEGCCEEPNMPRHMKGLVDHSLWGDWMQRRRPLAGQNKDGLDCERDPPLGWESAGLGTKPSSSLSTHWPCLISSHPGRAVIKTIWSKRTTSHV